MVDKLNSLSDSLKKYDPTFGIEVHVELKTKTKMFCPAPNPAYDNSAPAANTSLTPVSLGLPGVLPVLNKKALEYAIRIGLALNCKIAERCHFSRKNYFYPDMTKNFQTSQYDEPICYDGYVDVEVGGGDTGLELKTFRVEIERAHMEEDAGKNTHVGGDAGRIHGAKYSLVDYNRAGVPLVEIVTRPVQGAREYTPYLAAAYVKTLRDIFVAIGVSNAQMEKGNVRADVNLSLAPAKSDSAVRDASSKGATDTGANDSDVAFEDLGTRTETKNVNSFKSIEKAVIYEVRRQAAVLDSGEKVTQETRHWHEDIAGTSSGRPKSDSDDYRYFPEPDLLPVEPSREWVEEIRATLPELPAVKRNRLKTEWGFNDLEMRDSINAGVLELIEEATTHGITATDAKKWYLGDLSRIAKETSVEVSELNVTPKQIAGLQSLINSKDINVKIASEVLNRVLDGEGEPAEIVEKQGLKIVSDDGLLQKVIDETLADKPDIVAKIKEGNMAPIGAVMGAVMKATKGQADAGTARELILKSIEAM
ncbi:MAG: Asp-tRNA(Asn)/Glu-tRNA(Gln) amidotransferase subunit GatB [Bifidobacteriaceae bacterium]|jgi:aspartyl-tRNA(Asn)/glutamyl-tRNA(Gln) amidotransferase subunit B|nr:Asp-tRNA(Asn)/Glu-tRNA(Gln) amidotransferase subunit GatB [Bifidobacteriaceae bacterium]